MINCGAALRIFLEYFAYKSFNRIAKKTSRVASRELLARRYIHMLAITIQMTYFLRRFLAHTKSAEKVITIYSPIILPKSAYIFPLRKCIKYTTAFPGAKEDLPPVNRRTASRLDHPNFA